MYDYASHPTFTTAVRQCQKGCDGGKDNGSVASTCDKRLRYKSKVAKTNRLRNKIDPLILKMFCRGPLSYTIIEFECTTSTAPTTQHSQLRFGSVNGGQLYLHVIRDRVVKNYNTKHNRRSQSCAPRPAAAISPVFNAV